MTSEIWWHKDHPFSSSLTGVSSKKLATDYSQSTGRPWSQTIGFEHSIFEVAIDVIKRAADLDSVPAIMESIKTTKISTIVGDVSWIGGKGPFKNVSKTPLVGGQWQQKGGDLELMITNNNHAPQISKTGELELI